MLSLRYPWVWWILGWLLVVGVIVGSLLPGSIVRGMAAHDKLLHALSYFVLMLWFSGLYRRDRQAFIAILLFALGFLLDSLQGPLLNREFDPADVAANGAGILAGWILSRYVFEGWCQRVEQFVFSR